MTGVLYKTTNPQLAEYVFHDLAGWLMMPLALGMMWFELWVLGRLFVTVEGPTRREVVLRARPTGSAAAARSNSAPRPVAHAGRPA